MQNAKSWMILRVTVLPCQPCPAFQSTHQVGLRCDAMHQAINARY